MRPLTIIGNWKLNGNLASNEVWVKAVCQGMEKGMPAGRKYAVCAPFPYLSQCGQLIKQCSLAFLSLGAQDVSAHLSGAYTGEVSAQMLMELGCAYVIVGHSERRQMHHETDELIAEKALQALDQGITPIICVGESADERNSGREVTARGQGSRSEQGEVRGPEMFARDKPRHATVAMWPQCVCVRVYVRVYECEAESS